MMICFTKFFWCQDYNKWHFVWTQERWDLLLHRRYQFSLSKRITEWLRQGGTSYSRLLRATCTCVLSNPTDEGSTTSLGNLFFHLTAFTVKKEGTMFTWNSSYFNLCSWPLALSPQRRAWLHLYCPYQVFIQIDEVPCLEPSLVQAEQSQLAQPLLVWWMFQSL